MNPFPSIAAGLKRTLRAAQQDDDLLGFYVAFVVLCLVYRWELCCRLYSESQAPFRFDAELVPVLVCGQYLLQDLTMGLVWSALFWVWEGGVAWMFRRLSRFRQGRLLQFQTGFTRLGGHGLLLLAALAFRAHYHLIFELETGLTPYLVIEAIGQLTPGDFLALFRASDGLFLLVPVLVYQGLLLGLARVCSWLKYLWLLLLVLLGGLNWHYQGWWLAWELQLNPLQFLGRTFVRQYLAPLLGGSSNRFIALLDKPSWAQMQSLQFLEAPFVAAPPPAWPSPPPARPQKPWNIVFILMESVGMEYLESKDPRLRHPMPFFQDHARAGLYLTNHFTTGNETTRAAFSILTGLYPPPTQQDFSIASDASVPVLNRLLGPAYHSFLVSAVNTTYYFPHQLLLNNGFHEIYRHRAIPLRAAQDFNGLARNEVDTVNFFIERLKQARPPFLALYISYLAHIPFPDYNPQQRLYPQPRTNLERYYNSLRSLDFHLERIYHYLQESGRLDDTIIVWVSDHGEGFHQHPAHRGHGLGVFNETLRVPVLFLQPRLFPAQSLPWLTSHVDVLPTLLDALGWPHNPRLLQGESALRPNRRNCVFSYASRDHVLAVMDQQGRKALLSFLPGNNSHAFDLVRDPAEQQPLPLETYPDLISALVKFRNYQKALIPLYNQACRYNADFYGQRLVAPPGSRLDAFAPLRHTPRTFAERLDKSQSPRPL